MKYVRGDEDAQNISSFCSILERGGCRVLHRVDDACPPGYLNEFKYLFNRRKISYA